MLLFRKIKVKRYPNKDEGHIPFFLVAFERVRSLETLYVLKKFVIEEFKFLSLT